MLFVSSHWHRIDVYQAVNVHSSHFRRLYLRGDFPCQKKYSRGEGRYLHWKVPPQDLDYSHYLPIMFDGWDDTNCKSANLKFDNSIESFSRLCEAEFPYKNISSFAIHDMLNAAGDKVFPIIPQIILPIKRGEMVKASIVSYFHSLHSIFNSLALRTKNPQVIAATCRVIQHLCMCGEYSSIFFRLWGEITMCFCRNVSDNLWGWEYLRVEMKFYEMFPSRSSIISF